MPTDIRQDIVNEHIHETPTAPLPQPAFSGSAPGEIDPINVNTILQESIKEDNSNNEPKDATATPPSHEETRKEDPKATLDPSHVVTPLHQDTEQPLKTDSTLHVKRPELQHKEGENSEQPSIASKDTPNQQQPTPPSPSEGVNPQGTREEVLTKPTTDNDNANNPKTQNRPQEQAHTQSPSPRPSISVEELRHETVQPTGDGKLPF